MRRWVEASRDHVCGGSPEHQIKAGQPMQIVQLRGVERVLVRCRLCADGTPPEHVALERHERKGSTADTLQRLGEIMKRYDPKAIVAGE